MKKVCNSTQTLISTIVYRIECKTIYKILCQVRMRLSKTIYGITEPS